MSYLQGPRIHFSGRFQADPSTVNNSPANFDNAAPQRAPGWNPGGSGAWHLKDCVVTRAVFTDGSVASESTDDPVVGLSILDANSLPSAKIVDLDPEQQMCSEIWGLQVRIANQAGAVCVAGAFAVAAFVDIWKRADTDEGGMPSLSATYQSVLTDLVWGDLLNSRSLKELQQAAAGKLSIKFNVDGYDSDSRSSTFTMGRIVGTIGVWLPGEPDRFIIGRHCMPSKISRQLNFFPATLDRTRGKLIADFGNALPTSSIGGPVKAQPGLQLGVLRADRSFASLGSVEIGSPNWYTETAGICEVPVDRQLSIPELAALESSPIALWGLNAQGAAGIIAQEGSDGLYVRADSFVVRMSSGDETKVILHASRFGRAVADSEIEVAVDPNRLNGTPANVIAVPEKITTSLDGVAQLTILGRDPKNPRVYIDGQVYGISYRLSASARADVPYQNPSNFISVLLWDGYPIPQTPTWWDDIHDILQRYANLYPVMKPIVDLGDYDSLVKNRLKLIRVLELPLENPHYMPVTRDLSPAKRQAILKWLGPPESMTPPLQGTGPAPAHSKTLEALADDPKSEGARLLAARRGRV